MNPDKLIPLAMDGTKSWRTRVGEQGAYSNSYRERSCVKGGGKAELEVEVGKIETGAGFMDLIYRCFW